VKAGPKAGAEGSHRTQLTMRAGGLIAAAYL
jgi:hypothetical protein